MRSRPGITGLEAKACLMSRHRESEAPASSSRITAHSVYAVKPCGLLPAEMPSRRDSQPFVSCAGGNISIPQRIPFSLTGNRQRPAIGISLSSPICPKVTTKLTTIRIANLRLFAVGCGSKVYSTFCFYSQLQPDALGCKSARICPTSRGRRFESSIARYVTYCFRAH